MGTLQRLLRKKNWCKRELRPRCCSRTVTRFPLTTGGASTRARSSASMHSYVFLHNLAKPAFGFVWIPSDSIRWGGYKCLCILHALLLSKPHLAVAIFQRMPIQVQYDWCRYIQHVQCV